MQVHRGRNGDIRFTGAGKTTWQEVQGYPLLARAGSDRSDFQQTGDKEWDKDSTNIEPAGKPRIWIDHLNKRFYREPPRRDFDKSAFDDLELLGEFSGKADRELGTRIIDGKEARGSDRDVERWNPNIRDRGWRRSRIDAESNLPVLVRYEGIKRLGQSTTMEMTDICWNIDLDPKLFDTMPPKGYTDGTTKPPPLAEQLRQITAALKIYADASGGHYPRSRLTRSGPTEDLCRMLGVTRVARSEKGGEGGPGGKGHQRIPADWHDAARQSQLRLLWPDGRAEDQNESAPPLRFRRRPV